jgi:hypothetical protein
MELFFIILLVPLLLAGVVYLAVTTYRRYKENQLETPVAEGEDLIGDEWQKLSDNLLEQVEKAAEEKGLLDKPKTELYLQKAVDKFREFKKDYLRGCYKHKMVGYYGPTYVYDPCDEALAHNNALEHMVEFLLDKKLVEASGAQVVDFFAQNQPMVVPERKFKLLVPKKVVVAKPATPHSLAMPMGLEFEAIMAGKAQEDLTRSLNKLADNTMSENVISNPNMSTIVHAIMVQKQQIKNTAEAAEIQKITDMLLTALKEIEAKTADDQFELKTVIEARDAEIANLKSEVEKLKDLHTARKALSEPGKRSFKKKTRTLKKNGSV